MSNLRDKIFKADDIVTETVVVEEWNNAKIGVRSMSVRDRAIVLKHNMPDVNPETGEPIGQPDVGNFYAHLLIACCVDPKSGEKLFSEEDVEKLKDRNAAAIEKVAEVATRLSGLGGKAVEAAGKDSSSKVIPLTNQNVAGTSS